MEPKKLSDRELKILRDVATHHEGSTVQRLVDHIDAIEAEHLATLQGAVDSVISAAELGTTAEVLILKQVKWIKALEAALDEIITISAPEGPELKLGDLAYRVTMMRSKAQEVLKSAETQTGEA